MKRSAEPPVSRQRALLGDFSAALGQQMFFWGRDVLTDGNLLLAYGFERLESPGLKGTSCYRMRRRCGCIELHGACAGWYPDDPATSTGFLYVRTLGRCSAHRRREPIVPGEHEGLPLINDTRLILQAAQSFATWLHEYETWIQGRQGTAYRTACRQMLARLPKGKPWLPPAQAMSWMQNFSEHGALADRKKKSAGD